MKADRLLSILLLLQTRDRIPATELARRLEVSVRTVYRDVEALSAAGVPVYTERGRNGGIALLPGFRTDVTGMTADEARALFVLATRTTHSALGLDKALGSALRKVMAALPAPHRSVAELTSRRILVDPDRWLSDSPPAVDLTALHHAVLADRRLRIRYRHSGQTTTRTYTVDPYGLVSKAGVWYLVADLDGQARLFRADRLSKVTLTDQPVQRRKGVELAQVWAELRREVERRDGGIRVTARVRRQRLDLVRRIVGSYLPLTVRDERGVDEADDQAGSGGADPEEWVLIEVIYPVSGAIRQLLQFGTDVEVLDPPEARRDLARTAAEICAMYRVGEGDADHDVSHLATAAAS